MMTVGAMAVMSASMSSATVNAAESGSVIYVKTGASGTGASADDAMGDLAAAVASAADMSACAVRLAPGTYTLSSTLTVPAGVSLEASGEKPVVTISGEGAVIVLAEGTADKYASISGITVSGATAGRGVTANAYARIYNCVIENNHAIGTKTGTDSDGAGVWLDTNARLENSVIRDNITEYVCGGVAIHGDNVLLKNCLVTGNNSKGKQLNPNKGISVGGIMIWGKRDDEGLITSAPENGIKDVVVVNTTVVGNTGGSIGGAWMDLTSASKWINCVIWNNKKGTSQSQLSVKNTHEFTNYYSNQNSSVITVKQVLSAKNNEEDKNGNPGPNFTSPETGDYTLAAGSPLVDAGNDAAYGAGLDTDLDVAGNPRKQGDSVDVGAYERGTGTSAIEAVAVENVDAAPEYFNLQGLKVAASALRHGEVYIMRSGTTVSKILVK